MHRKKLSTTIGLELPIHKYISIILLFNHNNYAKELKSDLNFPGTNLNEKANESVLVINFFKT